MDRYSRNNNGGARRRYSRSCSRDSSRERIFRHRNSRSRSGERDRMYGRGSSNEKELFRDRIEPNDNRITNWGGGRNYDRERRDNRHRNNGGHYGNSRHYSSSEKEGGDDERPVSNGTPSTTIFVMGLEQHITEADIMSKLIQVNIPVSFIRLMRDRDTGESRGLAYVELNTVDDATRWMEITKGTLTFPDQSQAQLLYSFDNAREDSELKESEGSDEISNILTKKIMLRNLNAHTNEENVLMAMHQHAPDLAKYIDKVLISRDPFTKTSRGICYLHFETLVDSMNLHNSLTSKDPPLKINDRKVLVSYCLDDDHEMSTKKNEYESLGNSGEGSALNIAGGKDAVTRQYRLADVPRLADYSASVYASNPAEHAQYLQYYTDYYINEIKKKNFKNLPNIFPTSANSGATAAFSDTQKNQNKIGNIKNPATKTAQQQPAATTAKAALLAAQKKLTSVTQKGNDGKSKSSNTNPNFSCRICGGPHPLRSCEKFLALSIVERINAVRRYRYCTSCLALSHQKDNCTSTNKCKRCGLRHHTLIHNDMKMKMKKVDIPHVSQNTNTPYAARNQNKSKTGALPSTQNRTSRFDNSSGGSHQFASAPRQVALPNTQLPSHPSHFDNSINGNRAAVCEQARLLLQQVQRTLEML